MSISQFRDSKAWHHEVSWHQRLQEVSLYQFILTSKSILQSSTELARIGCIDMCIVVLCTSRCVVFLYNVPPLMGQVLGKVLLTSWEIS